MDASSENELHKELEDTRRRLLNEQLARESENATAEAKAWAREEKASANTASIVFFGAIAIIFIFALFGKTI